MQYRFPFMASHEPIVKVLTPRGRLVAVVWGVIFDRMALAKGYTVEVVGE